MKPNLKPCMLAFGILMLSGCSKQEEAAQKMKADDEAKARADAGRKEMETLPRAVKSPQFFKLNEPTPTPVPASALKS